VGKPPQLEIVALGKRLARMERLKRELEHQVEELQRESRLQRELLAKVRERLRGGKASAPERGKLLTYEPVRKRRS
jgi:hypothetical protein